MLSTESNGRKTALTVPIDSTNPQMYQPNLGTGDRISEGLGLGVDSWGQGRLEVEHK